MGVVLDLSNIETDRYIIVGEILGEHDRLINLLYQQKFGYKDTLIFTGNFINGATAFNPINSMQLDNITFIRNVMNVYSVKGKEEFDFLRKIQVENELPQWLKNNPKSEEILKFIEELPLIIKVSDYIYIVNAGVQPNLSLEEQNPEVFYSIGEFDRESRFYQFENPNGKNWYDFEMYDGNRLLRFCFGGKDIGNITVPSGYCLGRDADKALRALIIRKGVDEPIIVEV